MAEAAERVLVIHQIRVRRRGVEVVAAVPGTTQAVVVAVVCRVAVAVLVQGVVVAAVFPAPAAPVVAKERRVVLVVRLVAQTHALGVLVAAQGTTLLAIRL